MESKPYSGQSEEPFMAQDKYSFSHKLWILLDLVLFW